MTFSRNWRWIATVVLAAALAAAVLFISTRRAVPPLSVPQGHGAAPGERIRSATAPVQLHEAGARFPSADPAAALEPLADLLEALDDPDATAADLDRVLQREDLILWLLARLETGDLAPEEIPLVGNLVRTVLTVWASLPYEPPLDREEFLGRALRAGSLADPSAAAVEFAWRGQRLLSTRHLRMVEGVRPATIDGLKRPDPLVAMPDLGAHLPPGLVESLQRSDPGAARADMFLALLEDVLRAHIESGVPEAVVPYLSDPSARVRALACRLYYGSGLSGGWPQALESFPGLTREERASLARSMAEELPPEEAAELLLVLASRFGPYETFSEAWNVVACRSPDAVEWAYDILSGDKGAQREAQELWAGSDLDPFARHSLMGQEARLRSDLLTARYLADSLGGSSATPAAVSFFSRAAESEWNPLARATAWVYLAKSSAPGAAERALDLLVRPGYARSVQVDGTGHSRLMLGLEAMASNMAPAELWRLEQALHLVELPADQKTALLDIITRRTTP